MIVSCFLLLLCGQTLRAQPKEAPVCAHATAMTAKGMSAYAKDSFHKAIDYFTKAIKADPLYPEAWFQRANAYLMLKDSSRAMADFLKLEKLKSTNPEVYAKLAALLLLKDGEKAFGYISKAISLDSGQGSYYVLRGNLYFSGEQYKEAAADYEKAISLKFADADLYGQLGYAYSRLGNNKKAALNLSKAIELNPADLDNYANRAFALLEMHDCALATADYQYYLQKNPDDVIALYNMGRAQACNDSFAAAIRTWKHVLSLEKDYFDTWSNMGFAYSMLGDFKDAISAFDEAIRQRPKDGSLYYNRAIAKARLDAGADYCTDLKQAVDLGYAEAQNAYDMACKPKK
jgi:tetratricopeptide (TPR) repeat protein